MYGIVLAARPPRQQAGPSTQTPLGPTNVPQRTKEE